MTKVSNKKILAIVVTYNRKELLLECIDSLLNQDYKDLDILIVDNNSSDGTSDVVKKNYKNNNRIIYKNTHKNLGGAGGFNFGIKTGVLLKYDYLWLMDDDTIVKNNSLTKLLNADKELNGNYGFLSSKVLWTDNNICKMNEQKIYKNSKYNTKNLLHTYYATFVSFFIKSEVVKEVGLPIKDFFIWGDDVEYSGRIDKKYKCFVVNDSIVIHKTSSNTGSNIAIDNERIDRYKYAYRNEVYIARHNGLKGRLRQFLKINYHIIRVLFKSKKNKFKKIKIIINNSIAGIRFNPSIEYIGDQNEKD